MDRKLDRRIEHRSRKKKTLKNVWEIWLCECYIKAISHYL